LLRFKKNPQYLLYRLNILLARNSIYAIARYAIARPSVRLSVRRSRGWISQRRLKLESIMQL